MKKILFFVVILFPILVFAQGRDVAKFKVIEEFFKEKTGLRVAKNSVEYYQKALNKMSEKVALRAKEIVEDADRKTVLKRDMTRATDEVFRRAPMTVGELMEKIKLLPIIDLAELANQVDAYGDQLLKSKTRE